VDPDLAVDGRHGAAELPGIGRLGGTVSSLGEAVAAIGGAISELPLLGDRLDAPAQAVTEAGRDAVASAEEARRSADRVGVLLGISIALVPTVPVLLLYLPGRLAAARERKTLTRALAAGRTPELEALLAERAVLHLPYHRLHRVSADPHADLRDRRHGPLADAELDWYGVPRSARAPRAPR